VTRAGAAGTARNMAATFGTAFVVYRMPLWPADVYSVIRLDRELPREADIVERFGPEAIAAAPEPEPQGSLF
jgi:hypothetical protein